MNSEELELSLKSEFEEHIKAILAEIKQEAADFRHKIDAELEKHRLHLDEALESFSARISGERPMDQAFSETVLEHLRLARDEGARITADAMAEAEKLSVPAAQPPRYDRIREALNDISSQTTQSSILHSLVTQSAQFMPRGAFFIVRNEHFVGWQAIGSGNVPDEAHVRQISFPVDDSTTLGEAVRTLRSVAVDEMSGGDRVFLEPLGYRSPTGIFVVPLVARGRGVAVLYADGGDENGDVNRDALEMLLRVASLTVELLASNQSARPQARPEPVSEVVKQHEEPPHTYEREIPYETHHVHVEEPVYEEAEALQSETPADAYQPVSQIETSQSEAEVESVEDSLPEQAYQPEPPADGEQAVSPAQAFRVERPFEVHRNERTAEPAAFHHEPAATVNEILTEPVETIEAEIVHDVVEAETVYSTPEKTTDFAFEPAKTHEPLVPPMPVEHASAETGTNGTPQASHVEAATVSTATVQRSDRRIAERRIDLPIEVPEEERSPHTKARRFARLLVSEIKLYNEQKVKDGREAGDLYERLREAIDRSREMYDKRVEPPVASKFDYFHYELVQDLAQGDESRLGGAYPGATV